MSLRKLCTLCDGRARDLVSVSSTHFFIEGKPVGAKEFMEHLLTTVKLPRSCVRKKSSELLEQSADSLRSIGKVESAGCHLDDLKLLQSSLENLTGSFRDP